jgi:hypothetical protein
MRIRHKYKVHGLDSVNSEHPRASNSTFYETEADAIARAKECIRNGCNGIVIYQAIHIVVPTTPAVEFLDPE